MITYEVIGYKSKEDFDNLNGSKLDYDLIFFAEALEIGKNFLKNFHIIKVQSSDREQITILTNEN